MTKQTSPLVVQLAFVILVILIPVGFGIGYAEHQRTSDLDRVNRAARIAAVRDEWQLYDGLVASCRRVNLIRDRQNVVIGTLNQAFGLRLEPTLTVDCAHVVRMPSVPRPNP